MSLDVLTSLREVRDQAGNITEQEGGQLTKVVAWDARE